MVTRDDPATKRVCAQNIILVHALIEEHHIFSCADKLSMHQLADMALEALAEIERQDWQPYTAYFDKVAAAVRED